MIFVGQAFSLRRIFNPPGRGQTHVCRLKDDVQNVGIRRSLWSRFNFAVRRINAFNEPRPQGAESGRVFQQSLKIGERAASLPHFGVIQ